MENLPLAIVGSIDPINNMNIPSGVSCFGAFLGPTLVYLKVYGSNTTISSNSCHSSILLSSSAFFSSAFVGSPFFLGMVNSIPRACHATIFEFRAKIFIFEFTEQETTDKNRFRYRSSARSWLKPEHHRLRVKFSIKHMFLVYQSFPSCEFG